ncbi:MAG TPA: peptidase S8, partial [Thermoanaerobaculia bacterium]
MARVVVKFHEGTQVRLRQGALKAEVRGERERQRLAELSLTEQQVRDDTAEVQRLVAATSIAGRLARLFQASEAVLAQQRQEGEAVGGRELADLNLYYEVRLPVGASFGEVEGLLAVLNSLPSIEIAYAEPPAEPAATEDSMRLISAAAVTPNFQSQQGYLNAAPQGIDALYAWTLVGGKGRGIKIVDVEYAWRTT